MSLRELGFTPIQEQLYRALLREPTTSVDELAAAHQLSAEEVLAACDGLIAFGVIKPGRDQPAPFIVPQPGAAVGRLIERREEDLLQRYRRASESRAVLGELDAAYAERDRPVISGEEIERLEDLSSIRDRLEELSFFCRTSVFSIQPGGPQTRESLEASRPLDERGARRGLDMRVIHATSVLDDELNRAYLRDMVILGVQIRVTDQRPDRMVIVDEQVAVVPVDPANTARGALVVRHPGLLSGFIDLFHRVWQDAAELPWTSEPADNVGLEISPQDRRILELLASGCTDETSAREVGVSVRHLRRTISRLMQDLGAHSRFEAGVEAARRGWL